MRFRTRAARAVLLVFAVAIPVQGQILHHSFDGTDDGKFEANFAAGRAVPWVAKKVQRIPGKFGKALHLEEGGQFILAGERNILAGRGTLAFWCRLPNRPGPQDVQRILFVQAKERGVWNGLATLEWHEGTFRALVYDHHHGHGWHDPAGLPGLKVGGWHHLALAWDHREGVRFYLDGKPLGQAWGKRGWWDHPTPHAIHLCYPGADYDALHVFDRVLSAKEIQGLLTNRTPGKMAVRENPPAVEDRGDTLRAIGWDSVPILDSGDDGKRMHLRACRVASILDDRLPAWKVMDGRFNLFWPEWRAPTLGDVDFSGTELAVRLANGEKPTHLILRGLLQGMALHGEKDGYVGKAALLAVPNRDYRLAVAPVPPGLTGLRIPRRGGVKLHEIGLLEVRRQASAGRPAGPQTPLSGLVDPKDAGLVGSEIAVTHLPEDRRLLGRGAQPAAGTLKVPAQGRIHLLADPVAEHFPLDGIALRLAFLGQGKETRFLLRVQDPNNPRREMMFAPVRVSAKGAKGESFLEVVLDFWDVVLESGKRLRVELQPLDDVEILPGKESRLTLLAGDRDRVLREFAFTQGQLAFSYWQLGSEADGTRGADPDKPGFALLGSITHNRELKTTLEWVRRHVAGDDLVDGLWKITFGRPVEKVRAIPRLSPKGAPEWAIWSRELLERFRSMAHVWADHQGPDGQVGGGWNDDPDFPGVFLCLPFLGDEPTRSMFLGIFDGLEKTGYLHDGISRGPIDALHATDFLSWRAHLMMMDYGQPRHVERALNLTRALKKWTTLDAGGVRRFRTGFYSEDGPDGPQPRHRVGDSGLIEETGAGRDSPANRNFLREPIFAAWHSGNPALTGFLKEIARGDFENARTGKRLSSYAGYPFYSYRVLFDDPVFLQPKFDGFLRDRWNVALWRRYQQGLPDATRGDAALLQAAKGKNASEEILSAAYLVSRDPAYLVRAMRKACDELAAGRQFRGGRALGANDHFHVPGQTALSQCYLGAGLTWLRPASILPPLAVSWEGIDADVAALVLESNPTTLRLAAYNFTPREKPVRFRTWEIRRGAYRLLQGTDSDGDFRIDTPDRGETKVDLDRGETVEVRLPPGKVHMIELRLEKLQPRPALLPDLAIGKGDVHYDLATDRLKVVVHNIGSARAEKIEVRFEDAAGRCLARRTIERLEAPLDLVPITTTVWLSQPLIHPTPAIVVRVDPERRIDEATRVNNVLRWTP